MCRAGSRSMVRTWFFGEGRGWWCVGGVDIQSFQWAGRRDPARRYRVCNDYICLGRLGPVARPGPCVIVRKATVWEWNAEPARRIDCPRGCGLGRKGQGKKKKTVQALPVWLGAGWRWWWWRRSGGGGRRGRFLFGKNWVMETRAWSSCHGHMNCQSSNPSSMDHQVSRLTTCRDNGDSARPPGGSPVGFGFANENERVVG